MPKYVLLLFFTILASFSFAQQNNLEIHGSGNNLYLDHTISPKETFYSIGRMYNVAPKELASFNHLRLQSGLSIGDHLKIPLAKNNFSQQQKAAPGEALIPVYHTVTSGETLYRLGVNYNKVPLASLKQWNHLPSDAVSVGAPLVIGFLKVNRLQSPLVDAATPVQSPAPVEKPVEPSPQPTVDPVKPATPSPVAQPAAIVNNNPGPGGYFKSFYTRQIASAAPITQSGTAGVFKSTSGWEDAKYYCFQNDAAPGTIIKITDNASGKSIYAKVLDAIPDLKQNAGLAIIISNAAAQELGVGENKFEATMSFAK